MATSFGPEPFTFRGAGFRGKYGSDVSDVSSEWTALSAVSRLGVGCFGNGLQPADDDVGNISRPLSRIRVLDVFVGTAGNWSLGRVFLVAAFRATHARTSGCHVYSTRLLVSIALDFSPWRDRSRLFFRS